MTSIRNANIRVQNQPPVIVENVPNNVRRINFKADNDSFTRQQNGPVYTQPQMLDQQAAMRKAIEDQKKAQKNQKLKQNLSWGLGIAVSLAFLAVLLPQVFGKNKAFTDTLRSELEKNATNIKPIDTSSMPKHSRESICEELQNAIERIMKKMERTDIETKKGRRVTALMMEGPGGTGKTEQANQLAREIIEKFPGSEYYVPDLSVIDSSGIKGQSEQMMVEITNKLTARADQFLQEAGGDARKAKKVIVLLDEFDKVAMKDNSLNAKNSNDAVSTLKILINGLKKRNNVVLIANTNKADCLEGAIDSRMATKVRVGYLTKKQQKAALDEWMESVTEQYIDKSLIDKKEQIAEIITRPRHEADFRKFEELIDNTILNSKDGESIVLKDMIDALIEPSLARKYNLSLEEIAELKSLL